MSVTAARSDVFIGDSVAIMAEATDADGDVLTYTWTSTCGRIVGSGANVTFDATGLQEGPCTVTVQINDGFGHTVDCSVTIIVRKRPNQCPTVSLSASATSVRQGETVTFTATVTDPDNGPRGADLRMDVVCWLAAPDRSEPGVDRHDRPRRGITVSVSTGDGDPNCVRTERVTVNVDQPVVILR